MLGCWIVLTVWWLPILADDETIKTASEPEQPSWLARSLEHEALTARWRGANARALERAIKAGESGARLEWVRRHEAGEGMPRDHDRALLQLREGAEGGDRAAQYWLGHYHADEEPTPGSSAYVGNFQLAAEWLEAAARQGHKEAAFELGALYHFGKLPRDTAEAIRWFKLAAEAGHVEAAANLAFHLAQGGETASGEPVQPQPEAAIKWYQAAVERGYDDAAVALAELLTDTDTARKWLLKAARRGHARSKAVLALRYDDTSLLSADDVPDLENAVRLGGLPEGALLLGRLHEDGRWVKKDLNRALDYYHRAGLWGHQPDAELQMAALRLLASANVAPMSGGPFPIQRSAFLPTTPAWVPSPVVRLQIAELLWNGSVAVPRDRPTALEWFLLAAQAGSPQAMRRIGEFWEQGVNGEPDLAEAKRWYRRAEQVEKAGKGPDSASSKAK